MAKTLIKKSEICEFDPARVKPFPGQPRLRFRGLRELAESIRQVGQITPGKVTLLEGEDFDARLIDGGRRLRACTMALIPFRAEIVPAGSEESQFEASLAANFGKEDHDCVEIARAMGKLQERGRTIKQMADICGGKSLTWVQQHLSILRLHPDVQVMLIPGEDDEPARLAFSSALMLANHPHPLQLQWAKKIAGRSLLESRRFLLGESRKKGILAGSAKRTRNESFASLDSCLQQTIHRVGIFADMTGGELRQVLEAGDVRSRYQIIKKIDEVCDNLSGIADAVEATLQIKKSA